MLLKQSNIASINLFTGGAIIDFAGQLVLTQLTREKHNPSIALPYPRTDS